MRYLAIFTPDDQTLFSNPQRIDEYALNLHYSTSVRVCVCVRCKCVCTCVRAYTCCTSIPAS